MKWTRSTNIKYLFIIFSNMLFNATTKVATRKLILPWKNWKHALSSSTTTIPSKISTNTNTNTNTNTSTSTSTNSNPSEVDKFSSFAGHWWDSRANPLIGMNPTRIQFIQQVLTATCHKTSDAPSPLHDKRVLDIGCGGGLLTESMSRLGASSVVGVDASSRVVEAARRHSFHPFSGLRSADDEEAKTSEKGTIRYIGGTTVEELSRRWASRRQRGRRRRGQSEISSSCDGGLERDCDHDDEDEDDHCELFDVVTALEIIEHVPDPESLLRSAVSLLKPDGMLFVSTINRTWKSYGLAIVAAEYVSGRVPVGTHDWNRFWSPAEVRRMICDVEHGTSNGSGNNIGNDNGNGSEIMNECQEKEYVMKQVGLSGMVIQPPFFNLKWSLDPLDTDVNWIGAYQKQQLQS